MDKIGIIDVIGVIIDVIAVIVSIWSCIIAKKAKEVANNAMYVLKSYNNGTQNGKNVISNQGTNNGYIIGEQHDNK